MNFKSQIIRPLINYYSKSKYPSKVILYITNKCNLKCQFCEIGLSNFQGKSYNKRELSKTEINSVIKLCTENNIKEIYLTGGEPFIALNLWYLLMECADKGIYITTIDTNGSLLSRLTKDKIDILNRMSTKICISLDSADFEKHDKNRGQKGLSQKIVSFLKEKENLGIPKERIILNTVVSEFNLDELENIINFADKLNISHVNFQPYCASSIFVDFKSTEKKLKGNEQIGFNNKYSIEDYNNRLIDLYLYSKERKVSTNLSLFIKWSGKYFEYQKSNKFYFNEVQKKFICSTVFNLLLINYNADLIPCTHLKPFANISDNNVLEKWMENANLLKSEFNRNRYKSICKNCFCDYPFNYRYSLLYFPISNLKWLIEDIDYYSNRT